MWRLCLSDSSLLLPSKRPQVHVYHLPLSSCLSQQLPSFSPLGDNAFVAFNKQFVWVFWVFFKHGFPPVCVKLRRAKGDLVRSLAKVFI